MRFYHIFIVRKKINTQSEFSIIFGTASEPHITHYYFFSQVFEQFVIWKQKIKGLKSFISTSTFHKFLRQF